MLQQGDSRQPEYVFPHYGRILPDPTGSRPKTDRFSPESSGRSSPSWDTGSIDSTSGHSPMDIVADGVKSTDDEPTPRVVSTGSCGKETSESPSRPDKKDPKPSLTDLIKRLPIWENDPRVLKEAEEINLRQRSGLIPERPTARSTVKDCKIKDRINKDRTDEEVKAFKACIDGVQPLTEAREENDSKSVRKEFVDTCMDSRKRNRTVFGSVRTSLCEESKAIIRDKASQLSYHEMDKAIEVLDGKIYHALVEKDRRTDHRGAIDYLGQGLVPEFLLQYKNAGPSKRKDGFYERAVVLDSTVIWIMLLVRLVVELYSQVTALQQRVTSLQQPIAALQPHCSDMQFNEHNPLARPASRGNLSPALFSGPRSDMLSIAPPSIRSFRPNTSTNGVDSAWRR